MSGKNMTMKVFFDVDGVLIEGWHSRPERRKPWDATIEQDLGISRQAFQEKFFGQPGGSPGCPMYACVKGDRDLKDALAEVLPSTGYNGSVEAFVDYWLEKDSNINQDVLDVVGQLGQHSHVELYIATGQEHYRAAYLWNDLEFRKYFREMFYSANLGHLKNTPQFFEHINVALDIGPAERPLFFDDQPSVVSLARETGWDAYVFETVEDVLLHPRLQNLQ